MEHRTTRLISAAVLAVLGGFCIAVHSYDGPRISIGLAIAVVAGGVLAALSLVFGRRFWEILVWAGKYLWWS